MKSIFYILFPFVILSCKPNQKVKIQHVQIKDSTETNQKDSLVCTSLILDEKKFSEAVSDPFQLIDARIEGKMLKVDVEYGGGCGPADFELVWSGMLMKSLPPKASVKILLKDNDPCKALITKTVCFDISSVYTGECTILLKDFRGVLQYKP